VTVVMGLDQHRAQTLPVSSVLRDCSPRLVFRAAGARDAEELGQAVAEGFESYRAFAPAGWTPRPAFRETELLRGLIGSEGFWCLLALADGVLAGHVAFLPATRGWRAVEDPTLAHLRQLFLTPDSWGTGLARTLHARAIQAAHQRGFSAIRLFTPAGQARARRFYEREGWAVDGEPFCDPGFGPLELVSYRRPLR
jgi:GNAT superfamily N-acetyltransferase